MASHRITASDRRRYYDWKSGMGLPELATRHRVTVSAIERSIQVCRAEAQQFSQEAVETEVRRTVIEKLPEVSQVISEAAKATKYEKVKVLIEDPDTGKRVVMDDSLEVPDHATRLNANSSFIQLLSAIKINAPMVSVDARHQTQNVLGLPAHSTGQPTSAEAVIREIRAARGLALTDGVVQGSTESPAALAEVDEELADELEEDEEGEEYEEGEESGTDDNQEQGGVCDPSDHQDPDANGGTVPPSVGNIQKKSDGTGPALPSDIDEDWG